MLIPNPHKTLGIMIRVWQVEWGETVVLVRSIFVKQINEVEVEVKKQLSKCLSTFDII